MADKMQQARDTLANWTSNNPVIPSGMFCVVYDGVDTKFKVGDSTGATRFNSLPYATGVDLSDYFNKTTETSDDITEGSTNLFLTTAEQTKIGYLTVTGVVDLDADTLKLSGIETGAEVNNISDVNATDLTDSGDSTLHYHATDRDRSNHTGTQAASTISDFDNAVSNNTDIADNTAARHTQNTDTETNSNTFMVGDGANVTDKHIMANNGWANKPALKFDKALGYWTISNDGVVYSAIANAAAGTTLSGMSDTNLSSQKGSQELIYDDSQSKWVNSWKEWVTKTSTYTAVLNDEFILVDGTLTINLPTAVGNNGKQFTIKNIGTGTLTLGPFGSQTIDGNTTVEDNTQYNSYTIKSDGSNWYII